MNIEGVSSRDFRFLFNQGDILVADLSLKYFTGVMWDEKLALGRGMLKGTPLAYINPEGKII